jgi:uncharacterized phage infection (PIP) family protein YhgE
MIELSRLTVLLAGELVLGLLLLSGILLTLEFRRKGKIRKASRQLVERIQQAKTPRTERLSNLLRDQYHYADETLQQAVHDLTQVEMRLYQNIINSYLKRDITAFQQIDVDVENLVVAYQGLNPADSASAGGDAVSSDEVEQLKQENERLSDELRATMDTIGRMLNEYSSAFFTSPDGELDQADESLNEEPASDAGDELGLDIIEDGASPAFETDTSDTAEAEADLEAVSEIVDGMDDIVAATDIEVNLPAQAEDLDSTGLHAESMMDELEQVDIEMLDSAVSDLEEPPAEPGSLEDEWAKLLEEDAASSVAEEAASPKVS